MIDLVVASMILGALALMALLAGLWLGRHGSSTLRTCVEIAAVVLLGLYFGMVWNQPLLVDLMPAPGLIILANWLPLWGSFFIGIYATSHRIHRHRRVIVSAVTMGLVVYSGIAPLVGAAPECLESLGTPELQEQTTPYTCSPAAAVTMLRLHGIEATESEMAELCLTRRGTHWLGLYRGLRLKTEGSGWTVRVEPFSLDELSVNAGLPCVMCLNVDTSGFAPHIDHGFVDGLGHSVVYLHRNGPQRVTVFDPSPDFGIEVWNRDILKHVESGVIVRLVPSDLSAPAVASIRQRSLNHASASLSASL